MYIVAPKINLYIEIEVKRSKPKNMKQYFLAIGQEVNVGSDMQEPLSPILPIQLYVKTAKKLLTTILCTEDEKKRLRLELATPLTEPQTQEALRLASRILARLFQFKKTIAFEDAGLSSNFKIELQEDGFQLQGKFWEKQGHFSRSKKAENFLALYEEPLWVPWNYSPLELDVVQYFLDWSADKDISKLRVLDLGSGYGKNALFLEDRGYNMYGIDVSEIAIAQSKTIVQRPDQFQVGSAETIPYEDGFFDVILDVGCIHCSEKENLAQIFTEIQRVLKPEGKLFSRIFTPRPKEWLEKFAFKMYDIGLSRIEIEELMKGKLVLEILEATEDSTYLIGTKINTKPQ